MSSLAHIRQEAHHSNATPFEAIANAIHYIQDHRGEQPTLIDIAHYVGMSADQLQRTFSAWAGISPKKYLKSLTLADAKGYLRASASVLDATFESGLSGPGRLHDLFVTIDAVTPGEYKSRGAGMTFQFGFHPSPFGECLMVLSARGLTGLSFVLGSRSAALEEQKKGWENAEWVEQPSATAPYAERAFILDQARADKLPLLLRGSDFRLKVWQALLQIPEGHWVSYSDVATSLQIPDAARAVAGAIAANLIGYIIPCHRVLRGDGSLTGYRWDPARKATILDLENARHLDTRLESEAINY